MVKYTLSRLLILAGAALLIPAPLSADLVASLEPPTQTLTVGDSGFLDVFVTGTSATADPVAGYAITVFGASGVSYTDVTTATAAPDGYIFPNNDGIVIRSTSPDVNYDDLSAATPTDVALGDSYGAGRIAFEAVAAGTYTIDFDASQSGFFRSDLSDIPTTYTGAQITILPAAIPEPTTTLLLSLTGLVAIAVSWTRRRARTASAPA